MDTTSIEQMNKVRASLGLAPLPIPGNDGPQFKSKDDAASESEEDLSTLDKRQAAAGTNWQKLENERQERLDRQKRKDAAKRSRDGQQRFSKLTGRGLGDASDEEGELDTRAWLMQQKKRQKRIDKARKMEEELAAREREMVVEYGSKDLAGVKVGHEADDFDETAGEQILTLKDAEIGEDSEDDELENAELKARDRLQDKLNLKKNRPDYDPTEQEERKAVLSKYDEEIEGKKQRNFTLDGTGNSLQVSRRKLDANGEVKSTGVKISLDMLQDDSPANDYVDPSTIKVKKPKKSKKEKKHRKKLDDEDDIVAFEQPSVHANIDDSAMDVDSTATNGVSKKRSLDFADDDEDLQARLADQRRQALKKRKKMDATELARQMREEMPVDDGEVEAGGMTLDETSEFVANLKKPELADPDARQRRSTQVAEAASPDPDDDPDDDGDTAMAGVSYAEAEEAEERQNNASSSTLEISATGLEDESNMSGQGLGASLALLRKRGLVSDAGAAALSERDRLRTKFLSEKKHLIDDFDAKARRDREQERKTGRLDKMSTRDREAHAQQQNEARERYLNQLLDREYKAHYRPDVKLRYTDEFGRDLNQKEAFKHMSHMFHGKGSGKQKTEKRLKKIDDEKKEMSKGLLNVGGEEGGMMNVQGREGRKQGKAGVRLQ